MGFFLWLEATPLSIWLRESPSLLAFPFILYLHTLGLALLAGISSALALWLLTFAHQFPLSSLRRFFPYMWLGFGINAVSGVLLLIAYPAKALTNPVFYIKLAAIFAAVVILQWVATRVARGAVAGAIDRRLKLAACGLLVLWSTAVLTGRFLAYTNTILLASDGF